MLLVDDHAVVREGYRRLLERDESLVVAGEAASAADAMRLDADLRPDVVVLDIALPGVSGIEVLRRIVARRPEPPAPIRVQRSGSRSTIFASARCIASGGTPPASPCDAARSMTFSLSPR